MEYPPGFEVVDVIIEVDTSTFEAAMKAPRILPVIRGDVFADDLRAVHQAFAITPDDVLAFFA